MALEFVIATWKPYRKSLPTDEDREAFDAVMDLCRGLASAGSNATNPILFEPMMVSAVVALQKKLIGLEQRLAEMTPHEDHKTAEGQTQGGQTGFG